MSFECHVTSPLHEVVTACPAAELPARAAMVPPLNYTKLCLFRAEVSQGADTDSFGATSGSILGAYFGPGYLEPRWLELFNDDIHSGLAWFFERSVSKLGVRMSRLPSTVKEWLN